MSEFVKPMKVRITFESLNCEDKGQTLYYDFMFYDSEDFKKEWNGFVTDKLDLLNNIDKEIPF